MIAKRAFYKAMKRTWLRLGGERGQARALFIFGEQRSGTTMLIRVFIRHFDAEGFDESDPEAFDDCLLHPLPRIRAIVERSRARRVVFKPLCESQRASDLLEAFSGSLGVWMFRHYEDLVNSSVRKFANHVGYLETVLRAPDQAGWRAERVSAENLALIETYLRRKISSESARALIWYVRNCQFFQQGLDRDGRVALISYDQLVQRPKELFEDLFRFAGLPNSRFATKIVHRESIRKNAPPQLDDGIRELCEGMLSRLEAARAAQTTIRL